jgi:hypothetical protein
LWDCNAEAKQIRGPSDIGFINLPSKPNGITEGVRLLRAAGGAVAAVGPLVVDEMAPGSRLGGCRSAERRGCQVKGRQNARPRRRVRSEFVAELFLFAFFSFFQVSQT